MTALLLVPAFLVLCLLVVWWEYRHAEDEPPEHRKPFYDEDLSRWKGGWRL